MDIKLKIDGKEYPISSEVIFSSWLGDLLDSEEYIDLLLQFTLSPNSEIRARIAGMEVVDENIVGTLLEDSQLSVLRALLSNPYAAKFIPEKELLRLIDMDDSELCYGIANTIDSFELCNTSKIAEKLSRNNDPRVRMALASNCFAPKLVITELISDPDFGVRTQANQTLNLN